MKKSLIIVVAALLMCSSAIYAEDMAVGDRYHSNPGACAGLTHTPPGNIVDPIGPPPGWVWPGAPAGPVWIEDAITPLPLPIAVDPGDCILFGKENLDLPRVKHIEIIITYAGGDLDLDEAVWGSGAGRVSSGTPAPAPYTKSDVGGVLTLDWFVDQPDWEYVRIKNNGGTAAIITDVEFNTKCPPVPSLTQWGMIALGVLILAAGAMVIVRRRKAMATA